MLDLPQNRKVNGREIFSGKESSEAVFCFVFLLFFSLFYNILVSIDIIFKETASVLGKESVLMCRFGPLNE